MDQLLKKLHTQFKLLEDLTDLPPEEEKEFKERMAAEREKESRYKEYKNAQQGDDSANDSGDITKMSASELVKELNAALGREGIDIPDSGGNQVEDILAAIQTYKKSAGLATDADALVSLLQLKPPTRTPKSIGIMPTQPSNQNPTDMGGASEFGGAPPSAGVDPEVARLAAKYPEKTDRTTPDPDEPISSRIGRAAAQTASDHLDMATQAGRYAWDAASNMASGLGKGWETARRNSTVKESVVYPRLSESDEMARLVSRLTRLDETAELNEAVRLPASLEQFIEKYGWTFGKKSLSQLADELGQFPKLIIGDGVEIATPWVRRADNFYEKPGSVVRLDAREMASVIKGETELFKKTFGVPKGTQITDNAVGNTYSKNPDGSWSSSEAGAAVIPKGSQQALNLEKAAETKLAGTPGANPSTTSTTNTPKPPTGPNPINPAANILKPNSLPANLSWAAKSKRFLKYSAALAALGLVFDNGKLILEKGKELLGLGGTDPAGAGGAGGAAGDTAATDAKNSEEIKKLVKQIQELENAHGKDSDPAWSKAVEHANAVFKRLGIPPFDNSIPKPVAPAPRTVSPPAPVAAAEPAIPPQSVVPQDMVQPVDLQQNYQQQPAYQQNSNTFIPIPIPLGGFGGRGGGRGPQNGRGYPGAGGQLRNNVGTPGGGNRGGRR